MIVVNFSTPQYARGQQRLSKSLGDRPKLMYASYEAIGSPNHSESPYEFKYHSIMKGFEYDDIVIWLDSSVYAVKPLDHLEEIITNQGYWLEEAGHYASRWCNENSRNYFNLNETEALQGTGGITMFSAGYIGFNKKSEVSQEFLKQWKASADAGCFRGSHIDHRHDQTAGSIIATRLGMKYERGGSNVAYIGPGYSSPESQVCLYLQGML